MVQPKRLALPRGFAVGSVDTDWQFTLLLARYYGSGADGVINRVNGRHDAAGPTPGAKDFLWKLKHAGFELCVVSNTGWVSGRAIANALTHLGIRACFKNLFFSDEVGIRKPNKGIFDVALSQHECDPCEAVHIGDDLDADVRGAMNVGMSAIHVQSNCQNRGSLGYMEGRNLAEAFLSLLPWVVPPGNQLVVPPSLDVPDLET